MTMIMATVGITNELEKVQCWQRILQVSLGTLL
jgi:hypothetical protein